MNRRAFIQSVLLTGARRASPAEGAFGQAQAERRRAGWIIPTNKPDRFRLKVMAFNPIPAPDPKTWELTIDGLGNEPLRLKAADLDRLPRVTQSSRLKCVQCWSGRVNWEGFRCQDLLQLTGAKPELEWVRVDCADRYYDFVKMDDLLHPRTLFGLGMNGEALTPEHGAPLRLVMPREVRIQVVEADHEADLRRSRRRRAGRGRLAVLFRSRRHPARRRSSVRVPRRGAQDRGGEIIESIAKMQNCRIAKIPSGVEYRRLPLVFSAAMALSAAWQSTSDPSVPPTARSAA